MIKRLYRLILVLLILAVALWVVLLNKDSVTLNLGNGQTFASPLGAMIILVFSAGVLCTALVASLFGFKAYLRERGFLALERRRSEFSADCAKARSLTLSGQYTAARRLWESLCRREPSDVQSKLWLARTLDEDGNPFEALKTIDSARSFFPGDCEVLFRAAELNKRLGNKTAAVDNLALALSHQPSEKAARDARNISVELGRLDDALEYNSQLEKLGSERKELREFEAKIRFLQIQNNPLFSDLSAIGAENSSSDYVSALKELVRDFPESNSALVAIAELEQKSGNFEQASQALIRAAISEQTVTAWRKPIDLWVAQKQPERALSVARLAIKEATLSDRPEFEILLAKLYLQLGMYSDARSLLDSLAKSHENNLGIKEQITPLLGRCLVSTGQEREAAELWKKVG